MVYNTRRRQCMRSAHSKASFAARDACPQRRWKRKSGPWQDHALRSMCMLRALVPSGHVSACYSCLRTSRRQRLVAAACVRSHVLRLGQSTHVTQLHLWLARSRASTRIPPCRLLAQLSGIVALDKHIVASSCFALALRSAHAVASLFRRRAGDPPQIGIDLVGGELA